MTTDQLHAIVVVIVVVCVAALTAAHLITSGEAVPIFGGALGFAAGRSGTRTGGTNQ